MMRFNEESISEENGAHPALFSLNWTLDMAKYNGVSINKNKLEKVFQGIVNEDVVQQGVIQVHHLIKNGSFLLNLPQAQQLVQTVRAIKDTHAFQSGLLKIADLILIKGLKELHVLSSGCANQLARAIERIENSPQFTTHLDSNLIQVKHLINMQGAYILRDHQTDALVNAVARICNLESFKTGCMGVNDLIVVNANQCQVHILTPEDAENCATYHTDIDSCSLLQKTWEKYGRDSVPSLLSLKP